MKKPIFTLFALSLCSALWAQPAAIEGGVMLGAATYQGDLTNNPFWEWKQTSFHGGLFARFGVSNTWFMRTGLAYAHISGDDLDNSDRDRRAFAFENNLVELTIIGEWEPWAVARSNRTLPVSPYLITGAGILYTNPKVDFSRFTGDLLTRNVIRDRDTPYSKLRIIIPAGIGIKTQLGEDWILGLEATARYPFTDYLDGISYSANPNKNDWYALLGLMVAKRF